MKIGVISLTTGRVLTLPVHLAEKLAKSNKFELSNAKPEAKRGRKKKEE